jgi:ATP-dependent exoDNAse (exonuclease V) alpha subunit
VAGSGKTAALDVARSAFEAAGYRVLGTAISGQAARTLGEAAGVESRTIASLVWRLEHGTLRLDESTVLLIDLCRPWDYADTRFGGRAAAGDGVWRGRHNHRASRKASSGSAGLKRPGLAEVAVVRARARSLMARCARM